MASKRREQTEKKNGVWMLTLDRFGYDLTVVGRTREEAEQAMKEEYIVTYAKWNDLDEQELRGALENLITDEDGMVDAYDPRNEFVQYYTAAFEDCEARFYEYGKVEWE